MPDERLALVKFDAKAPADKLDKDLKKAYDMAAKAIKVMGAKLAPKPLAKDLGKVMLKNKKPAEFLLTMDKAGKATFTLYIGDYHVPLGSGTMEKSGAAPLDKDKKAASEKIKADLATMKKENAVIEAQIAKWDKLTFSTAMGDAKLYAQVYALAKKEFNNENYDFMKAVAKKDDPEGIYDTYIKDENVNLKADKYKALHKTYADEMATKTKMKGKYKVKIDFKAASAEIAMLIEKDQFRRFIRIEKEKLSDKLKK